MFISLINFNIRLRLDKRRYYLKSFYELKVDEVLAFVGLDKSINGIFKII